MPTISDDVAAGRQGPDRQRRARGRAPRRSSTSTSGSAAPGPCRRPAATTTTRPRRRSSSRPARSAPAGSVQVDGQERLPDASASTRPTAAITGTTTIAPGTLPGVDQQSKASVGIDLPGDGGQPQPGDVARAKTWLFNPAADVSTTFQWSICKDAVCVEIPGATGDHVHDPRGRRRREAVRRRDRPQRPRRDHARVRRPDEHDRSPRTRSSSRRRRSRARPTSATRSISTVGAWKTASTTFVAHVAALRGRRRQLRDDDERATRRRRTRSRRPTSAGA